MLNQLRARYAALLVVHSTRILKNEAKEKVPT
jgi:hypothetical protein